MGAEPNDRDRLLDEATGHYREHRNAFIAWAGKEYGADAEEAKDAFQEAICAYFEQISSGRLDGFEGKVATYLFAIGRNHLLTRFRSRTIHGNHSALYAIHSQGIDQANALDQMERREDLEQVRAELERMAPDDRRVLELFYIDHMDMRSMAEAMGYKNANVAKKKKCIAIKRLMDQVRNGLTMFLL